MKKNRLRLSLDILLTAAFLLLMDPRSFCCQEGNSCAAEETVHVTWSDRTFT